MVPAPTPAAAGDQPAEGSRYVSDVLAGNVRAWRQLRGFEQEQVAQRMAFLGEPWRRATVSEVERGRRNVTVPELVALTVVLGVNIEQLIDPRGPGGDRNAPSVALARAGSSPDLLVEPGDLTAHVCSHKTYAEVAWRTVGGAGIGVSVEYTDVRPDLTDVGPDDESGAGT